jgi:mRNA interferase YafQ
MRTIERSTAFKRDYRRIKAGSRYRDLDTLLTTSIEILLADGDMPANLRDHGLSGEWANYRECHLRPDLLLIYAKPSAGVLRLIRLGSHSDLFR